eukprot:TRINITY_DN7161_c0_g1_i1.p1 TRINITY_DN7161_c0_g1~~TRINITY_DN7161_c0_g1_i1.p1  ORF type:complete len:472 (-),score=76.19 TRINITY_DN7161_c0_g1_i1:281-1696(-)
MEYDPGAYMEPGPLARPPWYKRIFNPSRLLLFLTLLNFIIYFDRGAVAGLLDVIESEYDLDDAAAGFLSGSFMMGYLLFYIIFSFVTNAAHMTIIMFLGLFSWSAATIMTVAKPSFRVFVLMRMITGAAEASFAGIAPVYLDDHSPQEKRFLWLSLYYVSIPIGAALGTVTAGYADSFWDWRYLFGLEGLIMLPLSFLCWAIPSESLRDYGQASSFLTQGGNDVDPIVVPLVPDSNTDVSQLNFVKLMRAMLENKLFLYLVLGKATYVFYIGASLFWTPSYLIEAFEMSTKEANFAFGTTTLLSGLLGATLGGYYMDSVSSKYSNGWANCLFAIKLGSVVLFCAAPISVAIYYSPIQALALAAITCSQFLLFSTIGWFHAAALSSLPKWLRPFGMGFTLFLSHLLGDFPAAITIGYASEYTGDLPLCLAVACAFNILTTIFWRIALGSKPPRHRVSGDSWSPTSDRFITHG